MSAARVAIIMPVYNEARHLPLVLESISAQTFPRERLYFIAVDGSSSDGSGDIIKAWLRRSGMPGCVLSNVRRKIPIALNIGLSLAAQDDIVMRLDGHTVYEDTYIADAVAALEQADPDVACVGCAHRPLPGKTFQQRLVAALYTNPMGLGGADFRFGDDVREVDNVYLGTWRPGVLLRAGGFNEMLEANEDGELSARVRRMGLRILRVPLKCSFVVNRGVIGSIRQWSRYGYWRAKMLQRNPQFVRLRHVLAPGFAAFTIALALSPLRLCLIPLFLAYACLVFKGRPKNEALPVTLATLLYFPALQFAFAGGMVLGLMTARTPRVGSPP